MKDECRETSEQDVIYDVESHKSDTEDGEIIEVIEKSITVSPDLICLDDSDESVQECSKDKWETSVVSRTDQQKEEQGRESYIPLHKPPKDYWPVRVSNISDLVPLSVINNVFLACGALEEGRFDGEDLIFKFEVEKSASLSVAKLNNLRLPDKILRVILEDGSLAGERHYDDQDELAFDAEVEEVLKQEEETIVSSIRDWIDSDIGIFDYKVRMCVKDSCDRSSCYCYHTLQDRRRNPLIFDYSDQMCPDVSSGRHCPHNNFCPYAHTATEKDYHMQQYRLQLCEGWSKNRSCPSKTDLCPFAHSGTPDMLYNDKWEDLYVEGLFNTVTFVREAIRNIVKFSSVSGIQVLVITPSTLAANVLTLAFKDIASVFLMNIINLMHKEEDKDEPTVVVGTPSMFTKVLKPESSELNSVRAVIIDDITSILKDVTHHQQLLVILKNILGNLGLNKVVVTEKIDDSEMDAAAGVLRTKLVKVSVKEQKYLVPLRRTKESHEPVTETRRSKHSIEVLEQTDTGRHRPSCSSQRMKDTWSSKEKLSEKSFKRVMSYESSHLKSEKGRSPPLSPHERKRKSRRYERSSSVTSPVASGSSSSGSKSERSRLDPETEKLYLAAKEDLRREHAEDYKTFLDVPEVHPEYEEKYAIFKEKYYTIHAGKQDKKHCESLWFTFWKELMTQQRDEEWKKKKKKLYQKFVDVSRNLKRHKRKRGSESVTGHRDHTNVASSSRGIQETLREREAVTLTDDEEIKNTVSGGKSSESAKIKGRGSASRDRESARNKRSLSPDHHHQQRSRTSKQSKDGKVLALSTSEREDNTRRDILVKEEAFSVTKTLSLLAELCESLGLLGSALRILISKVQNLGATAKGVIEVLTDKDNAEVIKIASKKLKSLSESKDGVEREKFLTGSILATKLLEYGAASSVVDKKPFGGVDIEKVARATLKQDAPYIIQFIKNALAYEGVTDATVEDMNEIFMAVSSRHFTMALES